MCREDVECGKDPLNTVHKVRHKTRERQTGLMCMHHNQSFGHR